MPWRMILFLAILAIVVFFAGFNISNVSDISFGFRSITGVPIFISLFVAYLVGTLTMVPFLVGKRKRSRKSKDDKIPEPMPEMPELPEVEDVPPDQ